MGVLKFGGTSMGSFGAMQRCAEIVLDYGRLPHHISSQPEARLAIVVSAVAGVTDCLEKALASKMPPRLRSEHEEIVAECARHFGLPAACVEKFYRSELAALFAKLELLLPEATRPRQQAECLAMGEKLSSRIFAWVLRQNIAPSIAKGQGPSTKPIPITGESLLVSDSNYLEARLHFGPSKTQIKNQLCQLWQENCLPVIAGFTAADEEGRPTLLGRGGSDYSAAIIAAALEQPSLDIWTDVAGIYSCDPRLVPQAKLWPRLDFSLVSEMAYSGAKVVHPKSISVALQNQVAVVVRSTFAPQEQGTLIVPSPKNASAPTQLAGLVLSEDSLLLHMENPNMLEGEGYIAQIAEVVHKQEIPIDVCATSETSFSFSIHHADCNQQLLDDLGKIGKIRAIRQLYKLCCVGHNIGADPGFIAELLQQCRGIELETLSIGASHNNLTMLFRSSGQMAVELLRRLHACFLE